MSNTIKIKNSGTSSNVPASNNLEHGELAINYADGRLFYKNASNIVVNTRLISNIAGTTNQISVSESSGVFTLSLPSDVTISNSITVNGKIISNYSSGDEGGEFFLAKPQANTTLDGGITIDAYQNKIRFFEQGGSARGAYIDLTACASGAGTNLLSGGGGATILDGLTDVVVTSPEEFQSLSYNGTSWVNGYIPLVSYVRNAEANTLTTGTCVYLFGATGDHATVKRADNNSDSTSSKTIGVVGASIAASQNGPVITRGYVDGIDLSTGYTAGDILWLGENGAFTKTKPTAPDHLVFIGVVVRATNNGIIYVATQNGYELDELHNVSLPSPNSGEFLKYNGSLWVADAIDLGTDTSGNYVATISGTANQITVSGSGSETAAVTLSLPQDIHTSANPTFAGATLDAIQIGVTASNEIDTASGNLTIDSSGGTVTVDDNLVVTGNLTVSGTTTSVNTETLTIDDNIIVLNNNATGSPTENAGIEVERGASTNVLVRWNETSDKWELTNDGSTYGNIITTSDSGTITSAMIADGTIVNGDISSSAAVALSKLASGSSGQVIVANSLGVPTYTTISGDISISDTGVATIAANSVALGTDTTGNYMSNVSAGTGISVTHTPAEGSTATVAVDTAYAGFTPIGGVIMWSGNTATIPAGWLLCDGTAYNTSSYTSLSNVIGTRYGSAGAGTFRVPDFTGRVPEGITGTPTVPDTVTSSASSAVDAHTHTVNSSFTAGNATAHTHPLSGSTTNESTLHHHFANVNFNTGNVGNHTHTYFKPNSGANNNTGAEGSHSHNYNANFGTGSQVASDGNLNAYHVHYLSNEGGRTGANAAANNNSTTSVNSTFTAGTATTVNASTLAHTHTTPVTNILFIIRAA